MLVSILLAKFGPIKKLLKLFAMEVLSKVSILFINNRFGKRTTML